MVADTVISKKSHQMQDPLHVEYLPADVHLIMDISKPAHQCRAQREALYVGAAQDMQTVAIVELSRMQTE